MSTARTWAFLAAIVQSCAASADEPRTDRYGDPLPAGAVARLGTVRLRHSGDLAASMAEFLPDGKTILSATSDGKIRYWDIKTGKLLHILTTHQAKDSWQWQCAALSRDGKTVAVGGVNGVTLWDVDGRALLHTFNTTRTQSLGFSPDCKTLVTGGQYDGLLRVYDVASGKERKRMKWHDDRIQHVIVAPDNRTVISAENRKIHIGDLTTDKSKQSLSGRGGYVRDMALGSDGKTLVVVGERLGGALAEIYDIGSGKHIRSLDINERWLFRTRFLPGDRELIAYAGDGTVLRWDVATWKALPALPARGWIGSISPDGRTFLRNYGASIKVFDLASAKPLHDFDGHIGAVRSLAFSADGKLLASVGDGMRLWDVATSKTLRDVKDPSTAAQIWSVSSTPEGFLTGHIDGTWRLWTSTAVAEMRRFSLSGRRLNTSMVISADGKRLLCSSRGDFKADSTITIAVLDFVNGKELARQELERLNFDRLDVPVFAPDGKFYARRADVGLSLTEFDTGKELCRVLTPDLFDDPMVFAPDGRSLAIRSSTLGFTQEHHMVRVFDTSSGREKFAVANPGWKRPLAFSLDSRLLAAVAGPAVVLYDAANGRERWRSPEIEHFIHSIAFAPNGQTLATGHADGNILIWNIGRRD